MSVVQSSANSDSITPADIKVSSLSPNEMDQLSLKKGRASLLAGRQYREGNRFIISYKPYLAAFHITGRDFIVQIQKDKGEKKE